MSTQFDTAVSHVLENEGELVMNPKDPGGTTKFGISLRLLKSLDADKLKVYSIFEVPDDQAIKDLSRDQAIKIYHDEFWALAPFECINNKYLRNYLFDTAVNLGISPAIKCLQRACWAVFRNRSMLHDDGILGPKTLRLVNELGDYSAEVLSAMRSERSGDYRVIVAVHPEQKEFMHGWLDRSYE